MRWLLAGIVLLLGCSSDTLDLGTEAADGPPSPPRNPIVETLTFDDDLVTDSADVTGACVFVDLWTDDGWVTVITGADDGSITIGEETFCNLVGHLGSSTYSVPIGQLPPGWYTVCNLGVGCTEPFEKD